MDYSQVFKQTIDQFKKEFPQTKIKVSGGADYAKVVDRHRIFRSFFPDAQVVTELKAITDDHVTFRTTIKINDKIIATGWSRTLLKSKAKAVEFGETVSLGRALANFGLTGDEYASIDEMIDVPNVTIEQPPATNGRELADQMKETNSSTDSIDDIRKNLPDDVLRFFDYVIKQYDAAKHVPHLQQARTQNFVIIKQLEVSQPSAFKFLEDSFQLRKERMSTHG